MTIWLLGITSSAGRSHLRRWGKWHYGGQKIVIDGIELKATVWVGTPLR
ncbi:MAG: hypothetical protein WAK33_00650 [Silvibacterium sp.]